MEMNAMNAKRTFHLLAFYTAKKKKEKTLANSFQLYTAFVGHD